MEYVNDRVRGLNVVGIAVAKCLPGYLHDWLMMVVCGCDEGAEEILSLLCVSIEKGEHRKRVFGSLLIESDLNDPLGEETIA